MHVIFRIFVFSLTMLFDLELTAQCLDINYYEKDSIFIESLKKSKPFLSTYCIEFEIGSFVLKESSFASLDSVAIILLKNDSLVIMVTRYLDYQHPMASRIRGIQKAKAIIAYLVNKGISADRLVAQSFMSQSNPSRDHPFWNRTEFRILTNDYIPLKND